MADDKSKTSLLGDDPSTLEERKKTGVLSQACLLITSGEPLGRMFILKSGITTVGRDPTCDIVLPDRFVSSKHGEFTLQQDRVLFRDLGSSNGSFVGTQRVESAVLLHDERIRVGKTELKYLAKGSADMQYHGQMFDLAHVDNLTQIYNKKYFLEALAMEFKKVRSMGGRFCIIMFDLDHFKKINDTYGHPAGDYILQNTCAVLKSSVLRHRDIFARYGGEEFILLLYDTTPEKACQVAERMRQTVESTSFEYDEKQIPVTISLGVAMYTHQLKRAEDLIEAADKALYQSKNEGRNRVSFNG